jgi:hypothetical protein
VLNKWEQAIVDSLRYATHNGRSATIAADEVHIPMNAMEKYAEVRDVIDGITLDRLREICAAEQAGTLHIAPCKIDDKVTARVSRPYTGHDATIHGEVSDIQLFSECGTTVCAMVTF